MALQRVEFRMPRPKAARCSAAARENSADPHLFANGLRKLTHIAPTWSAANVMTAA